MSVWFPWCFPPYLLRTGCLDLTQISLVRLIYLPSLFGSFLPPPSEKQYHRQADMPSWDLSRIWGGYGSISPTCFHLPKPRNWFLVFLLKITDVQILAFILRGVVSLRDFKLE